MFTVHHPAFQLLTSSPVSLLPPFPPGSGVESSLQHFHQLTLLGPSVIVRFLTLQFPCPPFHQQCFLPDCTENLCLLHYSVANWFVHFIWRLSCAFVIYTPGSAGKSPKIFLFPQQADPLLPSSALDKENIFVSFHSMIFISGCYLSTSLHT